MGRPYKDGTVKKKRFKTATPPPEDIPAICSLPVPSTPGDKTVLYLRGFDCVIKNQFRAYCIKYGYTLKGAIEALCKEAVILDRSLHRYDLRRYAVQKGGLHDRKTGTKIGN